MKIGIADMEVEEEESCTVPTDATTTTTNTGNFAARTSLSLHLFASIGVHHFRIDIEMKTILPTNFHSERPHHLVSACLFQSIHAVSKLDVRFR